MARDFWQTVRPALKVDRIKKSITLEAGTFNCGFARASVYQPVTGSVLRLASVITLDKEELTIDFWAKMLATPAVANWDVFSLISSSTAGDLRLAMTSSATVVTVITSLGTYTFTVAKSFFNEWHRYTVTFSLTDNELRLYVDEELEGSVTTTGDLVDDDFNFNFGFGSFITQSTGYYNELAMYSSRKTQEAIRQTFSFKGNIGVYGTTLVGYWKMNDNADNCAPSVGAIALVGAPTSRTLVTDEYAPIKFGASFIAARYRLTTSQKISLMFPIEQPEDCTGQLCVSWEDDDGILQRRKFWSLDGVSIAPEPADYNGEVLPLTFDLEWWNVDGQATVILPEDFVLRTSKTTAITTSYDSTAVTEVTATADTTIAEAFALTLPATFASQQTY